MIHKLKAIILHTVKHTDNSLIIYAYTSKFGRKTYVVNCSRTLKGNSRANIFQPLFLLDIEAYNRQTANIHRIKEYKLSEPLYTIACDIKKTTIAIFLAEVLYKIIKEEEPNEQLFDFIFNSVLIFDKITRGAENFHLHFLANLSKYIGFYPKNISSEDGFFDIKSGQVFSAAPKHELHFDLKNTHILRQMLQIKVSDIGMIELNRRQREIFLNSILDFYNYHFDRLSPINSLKVFAELFNG